MATKRLLRFYAPRLAWILIAIFIGLSLLDIWGANTALPEAYKSERTLLWGLALMAISFPSGLIWLLVLTIALRFFNESALSPHAVIVLEWIGAVTAGYMQWFIWGPKVVERWRSVALKK